MNIELSFKKNIIASTNLSAGIYVSTQDYLVAEIQAARNSRGLPVITINDVTERTTILVSHLTDLQNAFKNEIRYGDIIEYPVTQLPAGPPITALYNEVRQATVDLTTKQQCV